MSLITVISRIHINGRVEIPEVNNLTILFCKWITWWLEDAMVQAFSRMSFISFARLNMGRFKHRGLNNWGQLIHISKLNHHWFNNGLSSVWRQAIIWTSAGILLDWCLRCKFHSTIIFMQEKLIWKCNQQNGGHFVPPSTCEWRIFLTMSRVISGSGSDLLSTRRQTITRIENLCQMVLKCRCEIWITKWVF